MDDEMPATRKRPASQASTQAKKKKKEYVQVDLAERFAKSVGEVLITSINEEHRQKCLDLLGVNNGSEAKERIVDLIKTFKASKQPKAIKEKSLENQ